MARGRSRPRSIVISTWFHVDVRAAATDIEIRNLLSHLIHVESGRSYLLSERVQKAVRSLMCPGFPSVDVVPQAGFESAGG